MASIRIHNQGKHTTHDVLKMVGVGRAIVAIDGTPTFVDCAGSGWQKSAKTPTAEERATLAALQPKPKAAS